MWLMMKELTTHAVKCSGSLAERYWHRPICSTGSKGVSFRGLTVKVVAGRVLRVACTKTPRVLLTLDG